MSRTWRARGFAIALTAASVVFGPGCAVSVEGSFDEVSFAPSSTAVAILDAHGIVERDGAVNPFERPLADKRVHLWLSGADLPSQRRRVDRSADPRKDAGAACCSSHM